MLRIEILTDHLARAIDTAQANGTPDAVPGPHLAGILRQVADRLDEFQLVPLPGDDDWTSETYREASHIDGVLMGAIITLDHDRSN